MHIRGLGRQKMDLSHLLSENFETLLFYPSPDAVELDDSFVRQIKKPVQLIVPDGNWRQASKVASRHLEFKTLPRIKITTKNLSLYHLRKETTAEGMATLQAIACALKFFEGDKVYQSLINLYEAKLQQTLKGRGLAFDLGLSAEKATRQSEHISKYAK